MIIVNPPPTLGPSLDTKPKPIFTLLTTGCAVINRSNAT